MPCPWPTSGPECVCVAETTTHEAGIPVLDSTALAMASTSGEGALSRSSPTMTWWCPSRAITATVACSGSCTPRAALSVRAFPPSGVPGGREMSACANPTPVAAPIACRAEELSDTLAPRCSLLAALPDRDRRSAKPLGVTVDTPFHDLQPCSGMWAGRAGDRRRRLVSGAQGSLQESEEPVNRWVRGGGAVVVTALAAAGLAACGSGGSGDSGDGSANSLDLMVAAYSDNTKGEWQQIIKDFQAKNPKIKVNLAVESWDDINNVITTR